ncbi:MAG TPA: hypothetical protein VES64_03510, partial [Allosphingosinicella sp.]|nr:hypothetical protein [Allosphingosinicella sp.]
ALAEASVQLDYQLVAYAHKLLRAPGTVPGDPGTGTVPEMGTVPGGCPADADALPFDPDRAMRILAFLDRRRGRGTGRGRRKGPPERSFDEAVASVLAKIEAIERHEKGKREAPPIRHSREGGNPD